MSVIARCFTVSLCESLKALSVVVFAAHYWMVSLCECSWVYRHGVIHKKQFPLFSLRDNVEEENEKKEHVQAFPCPFFHLEGCVEGVWSSI